jgi:hypothetical protein
MEQVGMIYWFPPADTEPHTNTSEGGYLDKCEVCGDTHWIAVPGQCGKG